MQILYQILQKKDKRGNAIIDQLLQNLPSDNDKFYTEHNKKANTYTVEQGPSQSKKDYIDTRIQAADNKLKRSKKDLEKERTKTTLKN